MYLIKYYNDHEDVYKYTEVEDKETLTRVMILVESDGGNTEIQLYTAEKVNYKLEINIDKD